MIGLSVLIDISRPIWAGRADKRMHEDRDMIEQRGERKTLSRGERVAIIVLLALSCLVTLLPRNFAILLVILRLVILVRSQGREPRDPVEFLLIRIPR
jgi:hypothetical protein